MNIEIYSKKNCSYCSAAKNFLNNKNLPFQEFKIDESTDDKEVLMKRMPPSWKTVPVVFIDDDFVGGYTELVKYFEENK